MLLTAACAADKDMILADYRRSELIQCRANDVSYKVSNSIDWVDNNSFRINYERVG